ncbi:lamin tail domain-containing protein [Brumimicrobium mesophilum]|uniref:lamin tail domain-containing protein n=1 Tax=Brumimicrobium mesophilum TaxID=392717 RepID=UPI000D1425B8|nr:lamin tail domain-containing protein [Brumimicrobium mesophilum]
MNALIRIAILGLFLISRIYADAQVMISQYIEANPGSTLKGIEIYNHTANPIDFSTTNLEVFQGTNGGACALEVTVNSGILGPYEVWVIGTTDLVNYAAINGLDISGVTGFGFNFNGNDALQLYLGGNLVDLIGVCDIDPGTAWSGGTPLVSTANRNIAIRTGICNGTITSSTDPSIRYETIGNGANPLGFGNAPSCPPNTISTTFGPSSITVACSTNYTGTVSFTSTGTYNSGNVYTVELSNKFGSFISTTDIGSLVSNATGLATIPITIPANTYAGTDYRIRVVSSNPVSRTIAVPTIEIINSSPCPPTIPAYTGILLNEFSNGPSGSQEFYELLVVGPCGANVDISGYILDDNNGDFGPTGLTQGHLKFKNHSQWTNIPVGSIIVIYYSGERNPNIPADDLTDANNDNVYILPFNNTIYFTVGHEFPNSSDYSYSPDISAPPTLFNYLNRISFLNTGDAAQTRKPNGDYFFGVSYGSTNGGIDDTQISNVNMEEKTMYFNDGDFRNISNWSIGDAVSGGGDETPGAANNVANQDWIDNLRSSVGPCGLILLPVELMKFEGEYNDGEVELLWKTETELNNDYFEVFHSTAGYDFSSIGKVNGNGTVSSPREYNFVQRQLASGIHYYALKSVDYDGKVHDKGTISVQVDRDAVYYSRLTQTLHFPEEGNYRVYNLAGQLLLEVNGLDKVRFSYSGLFLVRNMVNGVVTKLF